MRWRTIFAGSSVGLSCATTVGVLAFDGTSDFYTAVRPRVSDDTAAWIFAVRNAITSRTSQVLTHVRPHEGAVLARWSPTRLSEPPLAPPQPVLLAPTHGVYDFVVIGGGIVGTAIARQLLLEHPHRTVCVIEKEPGLGQHQSSHNSGVIHAGIYHAPGSLMGKLCVRGMHMMYEYCEKTGLPSERVGKLVVALREDQIPELHKMKENAEAAGQTDLEIIDAAKIVELEPNVRGVAALHSPNTGIADFGAIARRIGKEILGEAPLTRLKSSTRSVALKEQSSNGRGLILFNRQLTDAHDIGNVVRLSLLEPGQKGPTTTIDAKVVVTAAGLHMDTVGAITGGRSGPHIIPFRGKYYQLRDDRKNLVKRNIYPVPPFAGDPGVHFTPTVDGPRARPLIVGPSFSVALSKEAYQPSQVDLRHCADIITSVAFWKFAFSFGASAVTAQIGRDLSFSRFLAEAQQMVPSLTASDLVPSYNGVMANSFDPATGKPYKDWVFEVTAAKPHPSLGTADHNGVVRTASHMTRRVVNLRHAPSPAGTSSFALAEHVASIIEADLKLALI